jgi:hypothetical protein
MLYRLLLQRLVVAVEPEQSLDGGRQLLDPMLTIFVTASDAKAVLVRLPSTKSCSICMLLWLKTAMSVGMSLAQFSSQRILDLDGRHIVWPEHQFRQEIKKMPQSCAA